MAEKLLEILNIVLENRTKEKLISLTSEMDLRNDIGLDSLDLAELTVRVEAEYGVDIFEDGIINTIGEIIKKLESN
jgi:acyl carrier protein